MWGCGIVIGTESPTFSRDKTRAGAIKEAIDEIGETNTLSPEIKDKAINNLRNGNFTTYTVGSGKVKTSVIQKYCGNQKCSD